MLVFSIDNKLFYFDNDDYYLNDYNKTGEIIEFDDTILMMQYREIGNLIYSTVILSNDDVHVISYNKLIRRLTDNIIDCKSKPMYILSNVRYMSTNDGNSYQSSVVCKNETVHVDVIPSYGNVPGGSVRETSFDHGFSILKIIPSTYRDDEVAAITDDGNVIIMHHKDDVDIFDDDGISELFSDYGSDGHSSLYDDGVAQISIADVDPRSYMKLLTEIEGYDFSDLVDVSDDEDSEDDENDLRDKLMEQYDASPYVNIDNVLKIRALGSYTYALSQNGELSIPGYNVLATNVKNFYHHIGTLYFVDYDNNLRILGQDDNIMQLENMEGLRFPTTSSYDLQLGRPRRIRPANR